MKPTVGAHPSTKGHGEVLAELANYADTVALAPGGTPRTGLVAAVIVVDEHDEQGFRELRQLRSDYPKTPVVLLATSISPNLAVEIVRLGIADCIHLPAPPGTLWRKIERAMLQSGGPAIDSPLLALLWDANVHPAHDEKRRCFRSATVAEYPAYVTATSPTTLPRMLVKNLSILTEGCPGGFALIGTNVHAHELTRNPGFRFVLQVPEFTKPIPGQGIVKRMIASPMPSDPTAIVGVEYRIDSAAHETAVRRFWSESQRRVAALTRSHVGRIE